MLPTCIASQANDSQDGAPSLRKLLMQLVLQRKPVVFHNGLLDLAFLYHSFYLHLPGSLQTFLADLSDVFCGGVYDTKYIAESKAALPASYLEYVFRRRLVRNMVELQRHVYQCVPLPVYCCVQRVSETVPKLAHFQSGVLTVGSMAGTRYALVLRSLL